MNKSPKEKIRKTLNPKQDRFCKNYVAYRTNMFSNATLSYSEAYGYDLDSLSHEAVYEEEWDEEKGQTVHGKMLQESEYRKAYNVCGVESNRLLKNPRINERILKLMNELATDDIVDGKLMENMLQRENFRASNTAISEYNKVKQRITNKLKIEGLTLQDLFDSASK